MKISHRQTATLNPINPRPNFLLLIVYDRTVTRTDPNPQPSLDEALECDLVRGESLVASLVEFWDFKPCHELTQV